MNRHRLEATGRYIVALARYHDERKQLEQALLVFTAVYEASGLSMITNDDAPSLEDAARLLIRAAHDADVALQRVHTIRAEIDARAAVHVVRTALTPPPFLEMLL